MCTGGGCPVPSNQAAGKEYLFRWPCNGESRQRREELSATTETLCRAESRFVVPTRISRGMTGDRRAAEGDVSLCPSEIHVGRYVDLSSVTRRIRSIRAIPESFAASSRV